MSSGKGLAAMTLIVLAGQMALATSPGSKREPPIYELQTSIDYTGEAPPKELAAASYYEIFDRNFEHGGITGRVEIGAGINPFQLQISPPKETGQPQASASSHGAWTDNLSARLFRDGLEMNPAEFEIGFKPEPVGASRHTLPSGLMTVTRNSRAKATFRLSGPDGAPLEAGLYRLWIILDMRASPPAPGMFRGFAATDPGAYLGSGKPEPDPGHFGGLVFKVRDVDDSPEVMARYLAQRSALESGNADAEMTKAFRQGDHRLPSEGSIPYYRKAIELALEGLNYAPRNGDLLFQVAYSHVMLNECQAAMPYFHKLWEFDPKNPSYSAAWNHNRWVQSCADSEPVAPDRH